MSSLSSLIVQEKGMQKLPYDYHSSSKPTSRENCQSRKSPRLSFSMPSPTLSCSWQRLLKHRKTDVWGIWWNLLAASGLSTIKPYKTAEFTTQKVHFFNGLVPHVVAMWSPGEVSWWRSPEWPWHLTDGAKMEPWLTGLRMSMDCRRPWCHGHKK